MKYKERSDDKILDDISSAGKNYLGIYIEDILVHINELDDRELKNQLIERHYKNQKYFYDEKMSGTRVRVNSAIRIIISGKIIYALGQINNSDGVPKIVDYSW